MVETWFNNLKLIGEGRVKELNFYIIIYWQSTSYWNLWITSLIKKQIGGAIDFWSDWLIDTISGNAKVEWFWHQCCRLKFQQKTSERFNSQKVSPNTTEVRSLLQTFVDIYIYIYIYIFFSFTFLLKKTKKYETILSYLTFVAPGTWKISTTHSIAWSNVLVVWI